MRRGAGPRPRRHDVGHELKGGVPEAASGIAAGGEARLFSRSAEGSNHAGRVPRLLENSRDVCAFPYEEARPPVSKGSGLRAACECAAASEPVLGVHRRRRSKPATGVGVPEEIGYGPELPVGTQAVQCRLMRHGPVRRPRLPADKAICSRVILKCTQASRTKSSRRAGPCLR